MDCATASMFRIKSASLSLSSPGCSSGGAAGLSGCGVAGAGAGVAGDCCALGTCGGAPGAGDCGSLCACWLYWCGYWGWAEEEEGGLLGGGDG